MSKIESSQICLNHMYGYPSVDAGAALTIMSSRARSAGLTFQFTRRIVHPCFYGDNCEIQSDLIGILTMR